MVLSYNYYPPPLWAKIRSPMMYCISCQPRRLALLLSPMTNTKPTITRTYIYCTSCVR